jgi:hypothetical protein
MGREKACLQSKLTVVLYKNPGSKTVYMRKQDNLTLMINPTRILLHAVSNMLDDSNKHSLDGVWSNNKR